MIISITRIIHIKIMITGITPITAIRDMIIIINGETEMIEMRMVCKNIKNIQKHIELILNI